MIRRKRIVPYISVVIRFIYIRLYVKCFCDLKYDWLRLNGVYVCMYVPDDY